MPETATAETSAAETTTVETAKTQKPAKETRPRIEINSSVLERGYKMCSAAAKLEFGPYTWVASNLPGPRRRGIAALMNHMARCIDLTDLESSDGLPLDIWSEIRDDLSDAFLDEYTTADLAALVDTTRKFDVPKQYFFDMLDGVDVWIRNREFPTYDELEVFAGRVGGSAMAAAIPIMGHVKEGYEVSATKAGQAVFLTQLLANLVPNLKLNKPFLAQDDMEDTEVVVHRLKMRQAGKELRYLVRLYASRIEKLFYDGGHVVDYLDFDGRRSVTSLLAVHWAMLLKMKREPESVLERDGVLSKRDLFKLKAKHVLGTEGKIPIIPEHDDHHH